MVDISSACAVILGCLRSLIRVHETKMWGGLTSIPTLPPRKKTAPASFSPSSFETSA